MIAAIHRGRAAGRPLGLLEHALGRHLLKVSFGETEMGKATAATPKSWNEVV
jgi:hypothetical protein